MIYKEKCHIHQFKTVKTKFTKTDRGFNFKPRLACSPGIAESVRRNSRLQYSRNQAARILETTIQEKLQPKLSKSKLRADIEILGFPGFLPKSEEQNGTDRNQGRFRMDYSRNQQKKSETELRLRSGRRIAMRGRTEVKNRRDSRRRREMNRSQKTLN